jgi:lipooligosaccharide transport system permease protein
MAHTLSEQPTPARQAGSMGARAERRSAPPAVLRSLGYWAFRYKLTWHSALIYTFANPLIFMAAIGLGLGTLVNKSPSAGLGVSYLTYVAPGLLAGAAMQIAAGEATFPVLGAVRWWKVYHAMLATPLSVLDVMVGHLIWMVIMVGISCGGFFAAMLIFGVVHSWLAVLAVPACLLVGLAFAAPIAGFASRATNDLGFMVLFRLGILPLLLFSGVFLPVDRMPWLMRHLAYVTPLWHGVDLIRGLTIGGLRPGTATIHVAYLAGLATAGVFLARGGYRKGLIR